MTPFPRTLRLNGQRLNVCGSGRAPGAHVYINPATGRVLEVYRARVIDTGPYYALGRVKGNSALSSVRIEHADFGRQLAVGERVLIGPITYHPAGPQAEHAWPAPHEFRRRPTQYELGIVVSVAVNGSFGWVEASHGGQRLFVHFSQVESGRLELGMRVAFRPAAGPKGPLALAIRQV